MKLYELAEILKVAREVADEEWKKLSPERKRRICDNILKRSKNRVATRPAQKRS